MDDGFPSVRVLPAAFLLSTLLGLVLTPAVRAAARRIGAVARPKDNRWHRRPTALLGGIAIWLATVAAAIAVAVPADHVDRAAVLALLAGTSMFVLGLIDDFREIQPSTKMMVQLLIACVAIAAIGPGAWFGVPIFDALISMVWIVGVTNAFNLIDNMDGLSAGVAAIAAGALCVSLGPDEPALAVLAAALAGAVLGFLRYNFHPASVFMGDSGSLFIGSVAAVITLQVDSRSVSALSALAFPVVLLLIPIFDTTFVTVSRKLSARAASQGGRDHTSHRLVALGFSERNAVLVLYLFAGLSAGTALLIGRLPVAETTLLTTALVLMLLLVGIWLARVNVYGEEDFVLLRNSSITPMLIAVTYKRRIFEMLLDFVLVGLSYGASYYIRFDGIPPVYLALAVHSLPIVLIAHLAGFYIAGVYRGTWRYVGLHDVPTYAKGLLLGGVGSVLTLLYVERFHGYSRGVFIINAIVLGALMLASRLSFRALREFALRNRSTGRAALVYGAGDGGAIVARELLTNKRYDFRLVGFLDDDPMKWSRHIAGVSVLGGGERLRPLLERVRPDAVLLSTMLAPHRMRELQEVCGELGISISKLEFRLETIVMPRIVESEAASQAGAVRQPAEPLF